VTSARQAQQGCQQPAPVRAKTRGEAGRERFEKQPHKLLAQLLAIHDEAMAVAGALTCLQPDGLQGAEGAPESRRQAVRSAAPTSGGGGCSSVRRAQRSASSVASRGSAASSRLGTPRAPAWMPSCIAVHMYTGLGLPRAAGRLERARCDTHQPPYDLGNMKQTCEAAGIGCILNALRRHSSCHAQPQPEYLTRSDADWCKEQTACMHAKCMNTGPVHAHKPEARQESQISMDHNTWLQRRACCRAG